MELNYSKTIGTKWEEGKRSLQFTLKSHKELKHLTAAASRIINENFMMHKQLNVWNAVHCRLKRWRKKRRWIKGRWCRLDLSTWKTILHYIAICILLEKESGDGKKFLIILRYLILKWALVLVCKRMCNRWKIFFSTFLLNCIVEFTLKDFKQRKGVSKETEERNDWRSTSRGSEQVRVHIKELNWNFFLVSLNGKRVLLKS